ncbi:hypothetical protein GUJ93_ZPchr0001g33166 [Zizania palustris]|uniref:Uncharacterized protein n=1 Tax=Zizania palustris TaxID=103762 RepID=A0A8J5S9B1_ZIZPA|nr:hypothetical protein GUJ93_ZPchr0001g33166 [Zizania palustris]
MNRCTCALFFPKTPPRFFPTPSAYCPSLAHRLGFSPAHRLPPLRRLGFSPAHRLLPLRRLLVAVHPSCYDVVGTLGPASPPGGSWSLPTPPQTIALWGGGFEAGDREIGGRRCLGGEERMEPGPCRGAGRAEDPAVAAPAAAVRRVVEVAVRCPERLPTLPRAGSGDGQCRRVHLGRHRCWWRRW